MSIYSSGTHHFSSSIKSSSIFYYFVRHMCVCREIMLSLAVSALNTEGKVRSFLETKHQEEFEMSANTSSVINEISLWLVGGK